MTLGQLRGALNATLAMKPEPELQFQPDGQAPYETTAVVLNVIKGSGVSAFGFVGNEQYGAFGKAPNAPPAK
jgi:biopolymer transport protein ExbD